MRIWCPGRSLAGPEWFGATFKGPRLLHQTSVMTEKVLNQRPSESDRNSADKSKKQGINWADPDVPVGDAPAMPRWPMAVLVVGWSGWIVFLVVMLMSN